MKVTLEIEKTSTASKRDMDYLIDKIDELSQKAKDDGCDVRVSIVSVAGE